MSKYEKANNILNDIVSRNIYDQSNLQLLVIINEKLKEYEKCLNYLEQMNIDILT